ncbi:hypothetical protein QFZ99_006839 [Paraburkholderia atlantica]
MRAAKAADCLLQHTRISGRRHVADFDASHLAASGEQRALCGALQMIQCHQRFGEIGAARRAQRDRTLRPIKEPHAEQAFGFLDQSRQRWRSDAELLGGAREMQLLSDENEGTDMTQFKLSHVFLY